MDKSDLLLIIAGLSFTGIFVFGYWLRRRGKPYSTLLVTIHKLIGLGLGIYLGFLIFQRNQLTPLTPIEMIATAVTILLFAINTATGSLLSTEKSMPAVITVLNKILP